MNAVKYANQVLALDAKCKRAYELKALALEWVYSSDHADNVAYYNAGNLEKAEEIKELWEEVLKLETDREKKLKLKNDIAFYEEKIKAIKSAIRESEHLQKAKKASELGDLDEAIKQMDQMLAVTRQVDPQQLVKKGYMLLRGGLFKEAIKVFESAIPYFYNEVQVADSLEGMGAAYLASYKKTNQSSDLKLALEYLEKSYHDCSINQRTCFLLA